MVMDLLPFDKYELERSPLTQYILENVKPTHCWQVGVLCIVYIVELTPSLFHVF